MTKKRHILNKVSKKYFEIIEAVEKQNYTIGELCPHCGCRLTLSVVNHLAECKICGYSYKAANAG